MRTAQEILQAATTILLDEEFVHWTIPELCNWLNFGLDAITAQKPNVTAKTVNINLVRGTLQSIPDGHNALLRPVRNVRPNGSSDASQRKRVTVVTDRSLTQLNPYWDDELSVPYKAQAKHVLFDEMNPKAFYVYPGNDGTGVLECVLSAIPAKIKLATGADPDVLESYAVPVSIDETYHDALVEYILYRAYSKDMQFAGSSQRAGWHYNSFANAVGIKTQVEAATTPNNRVNTAPSASGAAPKP